MTDRVELALRWGQVSAVDRCAQLARAAFDRGVESVIVLQAGGDPSWVGLDAPERFATWAAEVAPRFPTCRWWLPIDEPNRMARRQHLPRRRPAPGRLLRALDHQLTAHVLAAEAIRRTHSDAAFVFSLASDPVYELSELLLDVLGSRRSGVERAGVAGYLRERRSAFYRSDDPRPVGARRRLERHLALSVIPLDQALPRAIATVYGADRDTVDRVWRDEERP